MSPYRGWTTRGLRIDSETSNFAFQLYQPPHCCGGPWVSIVVVAGVQCPPGYRDQVPIHHQPQDPSLSGSVFTSTHPTQLLGLCVSLQHFQHTLN